MSSYRRTLAAAVATIAASVSLYPIFMGLQWFWAGVGSVCVVAVAGSLTRLRRLPAAVCLVGGLAGLVLYLNFAFENARSAYHLLPTPTSLRLLWQLARDGFTESAKYAPPVPELSGMVLLAAAGIGLTALLTDLIAVRLENAALAGLPLLLLFTEPFTLSVSRSGLGTTIAFFLGTAGYLAMLSSEGRDRIREWERPNPGPDEIPDTRALATTGRRVGLASVALALCVPLFVPGLHTTRLFGGQPGIGGVGGAGGVGFPDPNTTLSKELHQSQAVPVLRYASSEATPQYFQIYVLDNLTTTGWQLFSQPAALVSASRRLPPAPGLTSNSDAAPVTTTVVIDPTVSQDELGALPIPYPATSVSVTGSLQADKNTLMLFDNGVQLADLQYVVGSLNVSPTPQSLNQAAPPPADITKHYLEVPSSYDSLRTLASSVAGKAKTPFQEAIALQDWFTGGAFKYTLNAPSITGAQGLMSFLTSTKRGYCQQFSFAMAVLARLLGIPSRVAYGFTAGSPTVGGSPGIPGGWLVTTHDAHSWPELYFQGFGWLRFEPTPQGLAGQGTATAPTYTQTPVNAIQPPTASAGGGKGPNASSGTPAGISQAIRNRLGLPVGGDNGGAAAPGAAASLSALDVFLLVLLGLLGLGVLVAAAPGCARRLIRRRRWRSGARGGDAGLAHAAWRELRDDLVDYRAGYLPSESPRTLAGRVGTSLELTGPAMGALRRIAMAEERARYAARPTDGAGLREDSAVIRRAIAAASPRRTRWLARLAPSSVLTPVLLGIAQAADFSGRLNPGWLGKSRLGRARLGGGRFGGGRFGGGRFGRGRQGSAHPAPDSVGESAVGNTSPVGAGTRHH